MDLKSLINRIQELSEAKEPEFKSSISKREASADFSTKPHEKRGRKVSGTRYGAQDDEDEDDDEDKKKKAEEPKVKRGRGRPKKHADSETGEVAKYDFAKDLQSFMIGNIPKKSKELEKLPSKKHKLKDWMERVEQDILNEEQVKEPLPVLGNKDKTAGAVLTSTATDPATVNTLKAAAAIIKAGKGQIQMPQGATQQPGQQTQQTPTGQQVQPVQPVQAMKEEEIDEVAAPGQEEWITRNKQRFIDQYGKKKGMSVLYATAWKRSKKKDESVNRSTARKVMEGYTLEDIMERYPHESKMCSEGMGMDESLYEELCEYYFKEGRIPRRVWHGSSEDLRRHVEECYMEDTGIDLHGREMLDEFENEMASSGDGHLSPLSELDIEEDDSTLDGAVAGGMLGRAAGTALGGPIGGLVGGVAGSKLGSTLDSMIDEMADEYVDEDEDLSSVIDDLDQGDDVDDNSELSKELYLDDEMMSETDEFPKPTRITAPDVKKSDIPAYLRQRASRGPDDVTAGPLTLDDLEDEQNRPLSRLSPLNLDESAKENKMRKDPQMEAWDRQLKSLLKEGMTVSTSTGQQGMGDSVSVNATDEDAHKLMKILQSAGISPLMGSDSASKDGTMIDVEPMAQDEVMAQLSTDDSGEGDLDFLKRMIGARGGDSAEMKHGAVDDYEQEEGHEDHEDHDEHGEVIMVGEGDDEEVEEGNEFTKARLDAIKHGKDTFKVGGKTYRVKGDTSDEKRQMDEMFHYGRGSGHDELERRAELKRGLKNPDDELLTAYGGEYGKEYKEKDRYGDMHKIAGPKGPLPESEHDLEEEMCEQCGDTMNEGHSCAPEKLDEWANSPAGKSQDEEFQTELDYMTKLISGGLNGMKQDQTTLPHTRVKSELSEAGDVSTMMKRLAGIRR